MAQSARDAMPIVPEGKVRLADYGTYDPALNADYTVVAQAIGAIHGYPTVRLQHVTRGYVIAGSMVRWSEARWSVLYNFDGAEHGRSFLETNEAGARAYFEQLTDPQAVSARRQEDAMLEDTVWRPMREKAAAERLARETAEKARKAAIRKYRKAMRAA